MHEHFVPLCRFGCETNESEDSLSHYVNCPSLWALISENTGVLTESASDRLALSCESHALLNVVIAFTTYHYVKASRGDLQATLRSAKEMILASRRRYAPLCRAS